MSILIFITGPSGAGKSTLRDYYCKRKGVSSISALTTRPSRKEEKEIHRTVTISQFNKLMNEGKLCLISENHGHLYGYLLENIKRIENDPAIIEVDSETAIKEKNKYEATIIRVIPFSEEIALKKILTKRDGISDRTNDLHKQMDSSFLSERRDAGDILFINSYDLQSLEDFCRLIESLGSRGEKGDHNE